MLHAAVFWTWSASRDERHGLRTGGSRRPGVAALGLRLFGGRAVYVSPTRTAQILTGEW
jgi:hypothetical protein